MSAPTPKEQPVEVLTAKRRVTIGLPAATAAHERRFPLTPEAAAMLCERGFELRMEAGAATLIHFSDDAYRRGGVKIVERHEALRCDIVLHLPAISPSDAVNLKPGAVLLTLFHPEYQSPMAVRILLQRHIISIALDLVADSGGNLPFADILSEIDGRAAMAVAASTMADPVGGKGILLGGVAGIVPCEVTIIGSGIAARAAAQSALGLGATVRIFDNDVYRLREAIHEIGDRGVIGSSIHPKVFSHALRSADVVIVTPTRNPVEVSLALVEEMKRGVIIFNIARGGQTISFPGRTTIDVAMAVPRTAAMALSTTLLTFFDDITVCEGIPNALKFNKGLSRAAYTFMGKPVNPLIASLMGQRTIDITLFLQFS